MRFIVSIILCFAVYSVDCTVYALTDETDRSVRGYGFRQFIAYLENENEMVRIKKEVDPKFELPAVLWKLQACNKAAIFEKVKGSTIPVVGGLLSTRERIARSLSVRQTDAFLTMQDRRFLDDALAAPVPYRVVETGPVKDVIRKGADADLTLLPVPTFFEDDSGPFITGGVGITRNPDTGVLNAGIYRIWVMGKNTITVNASPRGDLSAIYRSAREQGKELPIAVVIGVDPAVLVASTTKTPRTISELDVAGALQGKPIPVVRCENSDLLVPAHAEIVVEGTVDFTRTVKNTLGEGAGYYGSKKNPVVRVTAVTHRRDAIFYTILAGPSKEHTTLGGYGIKNLTDPLVEAIKEKFPSIKKLRAFPTGNAFHLAVAIEKKDREEPMSLIKDIFNTTVGPMTVSSIIKRIVVVDTDVDIFNERDVEWAIWSRVGAAKRFLIMPDVPSTKFELAAKNSLSVRVGIDATKDPENAEKLKRAVIPGLKEINVDDYLE